MSKPHTVQEIADHLGGTVRGDESRTITGAASIPQAGPQDIVFVDKPRFARQLKESGAGAVILPQDVPSPDSMSAIIVPNPAAAMAQAMALLYPRERTFTGVSPQAFLGEGVEIAEDVGIGPGAYIGDRVRIGRGTEIHPGTTVARDSAIGDDCILYSGVRIYHETHVGNRVILHSGVVLGADGFGFVPEKIPESEATPAEQFRHAKMPQIGRVVIEDDVEIGANTTIDRAALDATVVGRGTKIDDQVMIGHNCRIGHHVILVAQAGISGSVKLGNYVTIAGQSGVAGHVEVGDRVILGAQSGISKDIPAGKIVLGAPAFDARQARKAYSLIEHLPDFKKSLAQHTRKIEVLEEKLEGGAGPERSTSP